MTMTSTDLFENKEVVVAVPEITSDEVLRRYPRLVAHLICQSLGYFTPRSSAMAIRDYMMGRANYCEWYYSMTSQRLVSTGFSQTNPCTNEQFERAAREVTRDTINWAFEGRSRHKGYMAEYQRAFELVLREQAGNSDPLMLASWM